MQTQHTDTEQIDQQSATSPTGRGRHKRNSWLTGIGAFLVVLVVIVSSVVVFSLAGKGRQGQGNTPPALPAGQWKPVENGYLLLSMTAAASNSSVLYACATTSNTVSSSNAPGQVTILRSADAGNSWQNIGANLLQGTICQLAVNPANSNDLVVFTDTTATQTVGVLKHSADGGKTWETIQPALVSSTIRTSTLLSLQQLQFSGSTLYAIAWSNQRPPIVEPSAATLFAPHLVKSGDGGHTWTFVDSQIATQGVMAWSYAVNPADANTIYELVGRPAMPVQQVPPKGAPIPYGINQALYKTSDGGASWTLALSSVPYASQVQLASGNPSIVYVGGVSGPIPLVAQSGSSPQNTVPDVIGGFHLQVSMDSGASWNAVASATDQGAIQSWFVSADGHVYTSPTVANNVPGVSGTGIAATVIVGTVVPIQSTPFSTRVPQSEPPVIVSPPSSQVQQSQNQSTINTSPPISVPTPGPATIQRYDPATNQWSKVTTPPTSGQLLNVTPSGTNGGVILWFMGVSGSQSEQFTLYRYVL